MFQKIINFIINFLCSLLNIQRETAASKKQYQREYSKKTIMTAYEYSFYQKIRPLEEKQNIRIIPQLNLASIIKKTSNERYQNELYRNIDFAIFNNELTEVLLLIELNDKTHNTKKRKYRDSKVRNLLKSVGVELMTFYTTYDNDTDYVQARIIKALVQSNPASIIDETSIKK